MPVYTCTTAEGTLGGAVKAELAREITRIHAEINKVPQAYVNVIFTERPPGDVFVGGAPGTPLIITGWARRGHPQDEITRLAQELASAAARISGVEERHLLVVIQDSPARSAVEGGLVLPEPGHEEEWLRQVEG